MWKQFIRDKTSRRRESTTVDLRAELNRALERGQMNEALDIYEEIDLVGWVAVTPETRASVTSSIETGPARPPPPVRISS